MSGNCQGLWFTPLQALPPLISQGLPDFKAGILTSLVFSADDALARLEYGEAHVAIRAGSRPAKRRRYVVLPFSQNFCFGSVCSKSYIETVRACRIRPTVGHIIRRLQEMDRSRTPFRIG